MRQKIFSCVMIKRPRGLSLILLWGSNNLFRCNDLMSNSPEHHKPLANKVERKCHSETFLSPFKFLGSETLNNAVNIQSNNSQNAVKMQSKRSQNEAKMESKCSQNTVKMQSKRSKNEAKMVSKCSQNVAKMQSKFSQNSVKMHICNVLPSFGIFDANLTELSFRFSFQLFVYST